MQGIRWSTTRAGPSRWPPSDDGMGFELFVPLGRGPFLEGIPPLLMAIGPASITSREQQLNKEGHIGRAIGRDPVPVAVEGLRKLLQDFNTRSGAKMSAIVSRSGVPVAWVLPDETQVDNFATMAATLLGALEVIYATMKAATPTHVTVESEGGILSVREVTGKMFFVAMATRRSPQMVKSIEELLVKAKGLLT